ncbi:MAG: hypothetical protein KKE51_00430 [Gammaproteobacteria bacterium]|nr:hypothetical protein [Gammaproteobacteria bacterium]MBU1600457.1 hypothetical protein [Gammaproteobacteria bacterium]MBU2434913.1 hypothetical protein [Gammaproteobacteria bacterium]MBU2448149.1 hypothetical protein [Gammaproteobacteria bacterium]
MEMKLSRLIQLAQEFRNAIEGISVEHRPVGMRDFPFGSCGDSSLLLGAYLSDMDIDGFFYVCGERGSKADDSWTSHAWLQRGSCVIDITADQFQDAPTNIIVADPSLWHQQFQTEAPQPADFRLWTGYGAEILVPMYSSLKRSLGLFPADS